MVLPLHAAFSKLASSCSLSCQELAASKKVADLVRACFQQVPYKHSFVIEWVGSSACGTAIVGSDIDISAVWEVAADEVPPCDVYSKCFAICEWAISEGLLLDGRHGSYRVPGLQTKLDIVAGLRPKGDQVSWKESAALMLADVKDMDPTLEPDMDYIADWETELNIGLNISKVKAVQKLPEGLLHAIKILKLWRRRITKKNHFSRPSGYALTVVAAGVVALNGLSMSDPASICCAVWHFLGSIPDPGSHKTLLELHVSPELSTASVSEVAEMLGDRGLRVIEPFAEFRSPLKRNLLFDVDFTPLKTESLRAAAIYDSMASHRERVEDGVFASLFDA